MSEKKTSLYIHIPYCISKCRYCDFFSRSCGQGIVPDEYIRALCKEIRYRLKENNSYLLDTLYIGGGTPSLMKSSQISLLFEGLKDCVSFTEDKEISFEVNPDDITEELLEVLERAGVNRISCGIQSMNDKVLSFAGRRARASINTHSLALLEKYWKSDKNKLSLDLICALPYESMQSFTEGLEIISKVKPDHISMYSLTIEENTPFGQALKAGALAYDYEAADNMWLYGKDFLQTQGYPQYEISNFARKENRCRHNLVYWNHGDYIGAGSGATGTLYNEKGQAFRWTNTLNIENYINFWNQTDFKNIKNEIPQQTEKLSVKTSEFEFFMMALRKTDGFSLEEYKKCFNKALPAKFLKVFKSWEEKGLALHDTRYFLNDKGLLFLNSFLEELI